MRVVESVSVQSHNESTLAAAPGLESGIIKKTEECGEMSRRVAQQMSAAAGLDYMQYGSVYLFIFSSPDVLCKVALIAASSVLTSS